MLDVDDSAIVMITHQPSDDESAEVSCETVHTPLVDETVHIDNPVHTPSVTETAPSPPATASVTETPHSTIPSSPLGSS